MTELRSAEDATNVMALDGVCLRGEIGVMVRDSLVLGGWDLNW
jgi:hypothetical protein